MRFGELEDPSYRCILAKYIAMIVACEGIHYVENQNRMELHGDMKFTDREWSILKGMVKEHYID